MYFLSKLSLQKQILWFCIGEKCWKKMYETTFVLKVDCLDSETKDTIVYFCTCSFNSLMQCLHDIVL